jgi:hypothetical protein
VSDGTAELRQFAIAVGRIADGAYEDVDGVITKAAVNVKTEMVADVSKSPHFKGMAGSITYEHHNTRGVIRREVGPDKGRRGGALGNIYYFGTSRGGGSGKIEKPLNSEEPRLMSAIQALVDRWEADL